MLRQYAIKDDEKKLIESVQESADQLEHLFETDVDQPQAEPAAAVPG